MSAHTDDSRQITGGIIWKQLLIFFFPIMLGSFFQQLYNTVDTVIVGQFVGKEALAAVGGSAAQISSLIVGFFTGLSSGATVIIAHFFGARDKRSASRAVHNAYVLALTGGIILTVIGIALTPVMLALMNTPADTMRDSVVYLRIYFGALTFTFIYNMGSSILRAAGNSRTPLYYLIVCCFTNIVLDILFVAGLGMGVEGAAIATFLSQALSAVLITVRLATDRGPLRITRKRMRFTWPILSSQMRLGIPTAVESVLFAITNIVIQAALNTFGTDVVAAWSAYGKLDIVFWMVSTSFGIAITSFVGQNHGAGRPDRVKKSTWICLLMDLAVSIAIVAGLLLLRTWLFRLFTTDQEVIRIGCRMMVLIVPWYVVYAFIEVLAGALRGVGDVLVPLVITLIGICALRVIWLVGAMEISPTIETIIFSYPVTWLLTALAFIVYYCRRLILENREKHVDKQTRV